MSNLKQFREALDNGEIRKTPDNEVAVLDVIQALTGKTYEQANGTYKWIRSQHLELMAFTYTYSFGIGRPSSVMTIDGILQLIMVLPGVKAAKFRQDAARLICRYLSADITLADDIFQRNKNPDDQKWLETRMEGKKARRVFTDAIQTHGGTGRVYADASDINNVAITGKTARSLQRERGVKSTREGLSLTELAATMFAENLEADQMDVRDINGNAQILDVTREISSVVGGMVRKYGRKEILAETSN